MGRGCRTLVVGICSWLLALCASGQWLTQDIPLRAGWNPVYLEVAPADSSCDVVFANPAIESVWKFNKRFTTVEFDTDPGLPFPEPTHWLMWLPPSHPQYFLRSLLGVEGGQTYLIKVADGASPFTLSIQGQPVIPEIDWMPNYYNFVGFPVNPADPPTFAEYFLHADEIDGTPGDSATICTIGLDGHERPVRYTGRVEMERGVGYWVRCDNPTEFTAPISVRTGTGKRLDFDQQLTEQDLYIGNVSTSAAFTVTIRPVSSEAPPAGMPEKAGDVPLAYFDRDLASNVWGWVDLPPGGISRTLDPGGTWELRLGVRRMDMTSYTPTGTNGAAYQSLLEITDSAQYSLCYVPVTADNPPHVVRRLYSSDTNLPTHHLHEGLWVGEATVDKVSRAALGTNITWDAAVPTNTASPFTLRLIVHVDSTGRVQFLQRVLMSWVPPPTTNGTGHYALWSDESLVPTGGAGSYRISSAAFPPGPPLPMTGTMTNELTCTMALDYNHPVNPFKHAYHPDHDNLDARWQPVGAGVESFSVARDVTLDFGTNSVDDDSQPLWGVDRRDGTYRETLHGLLHAPIYLEGRFELDRINRIGALDD